MSFATDMLFLEGYLVTPAAVAAATRRERGDAEVELLGGNALQAESTQVASRAEVALRAGDCAVCA